MKSYQLRDRGKNTADTVFEEHKAKAKKSGSVDKTGGLGPAKSRLSLTQTPQQTKS